MAVNQRLQRIASEQEGYFTTGQAVEAGYPTNMQTYHSGLGNWKKVARGLYRLAGFPDTARSELIRWALWARGRNQSRVIAVSHESALHYYGLTPTPPQAVHLTVSTFRKHDGNEACVQHLEALPPEDYAAPEGFPVTTAKRTLRDMKPDLLQQGAWLPTLRLAWEKGQLSESAVRELTNVAEAQTILASQTALSALMPPVEHGRRGLDFQGRPLPGEAKGWKMPSRSFTLVEMLVVVAIIAVLAAILMPALQSALESSRLAACAGNLRQIGIAAQSYMSDHGGGFPFSRTPSGTIYSPPKTYSTTGTNAAFLGKQFVAFARTYADAPNMVGVGWTRRDHGIFVCPAKPNIRPGTNNGEPEVSYMGAHWMWALLYRNPKTHFATSAALMSEVQALYGWDGNLFRLSGTKSPSTMPLFFDEAVAIVFEARNVSNHALALMNVLYLDGSLIVQPLDPGWQANYMGTQPGGLGPSWYAPYIRKAPFPTK